MSAEAPNTLEGWRSSYFYQHKQNQGLHTRIAQLEALLKASKHREAPLDSTVDIHQKRVKELEAAAPSPEVLKTIRAVWGTWPVLDETDSLLYEAVETWMRKALEAGA